MSGVPDTSHDVMQLPSWDEYDELECSQDAPTDDPTHSGSSARYPFSIEEPGGSGMNVSSPLPRVEDGDSQQPVLSANAPTLPAGFLADQRLHPDDPENPNYPEDPNIPCRNNETADHGLPQLFVHGAEEPLAAVAATSHRDEAPSLPDEELRLVRRRGMHDNQLPPPEPNQARVIQSSSHPDLTLPDAGNDSEDHFGPLPPGDLNIPTGSEADDRIPASPSQSNSHPLEMPFDDEESINHHDAAGPTRQTTNSTIEKAILDFDEPGPSTSSAPAEPFFSRHVRPPVLIEVAPESPKPSTSGINNVPHTNGSAEIVVEPNNTRKRRSDNGTVNKSVPKMVKKSNGSRPNVPNNCRSPSNEDLTSHSTVRTTVDK